MFLENPIPQKGLCFLNTDDQIRFSGSSEFLMNRVFKQVTQFEKQNNIYYQ